MGRKRKPGGGCKPSKLDYNPSAVLQNQIDAAVALYSIDDHPSLQTIADELDLNPIFRGGTPELALCQKYPGSGCQCRCLQHYRDGTAERSETPMYT